MKPFRNGVLTGLALILLNTILFIAVFFLFSALKELGQRIGISNDLIIFQPRTLNVLTYILFLLLVSVGAFFAYRSKLSTFMKACLASVPFVVLLATVDTILHQRPSYLAQGFIVLIVLHFLYKAKQPWLYYVSVISSLLIYNSFMVIIKKIDM